MNDHQQFEKESASGFGSDVMALSESEIKLVEQVRRSVVWWRRLRWFLTLFYVLIIAAAAAIGREAMKVLDGLAAQPNGWQWIGITLACLVGLQIGHAMQHGLVGLINAWFGQKSELLLIKCFDRVRELEAARNDFQSVT